MLCAPPGAPLELGDDLGNVGGQRDRLGERGAQILAAKRAISGGEANLASLMEGNPPDCIATPTGMSAPVTVAKGLALGVFLWFVSASVVMPLIGWGAFGGAVSPIIWFATLVLHVAYGVPLGLAIDRHGRTASATRPATTLRHGHA